MQANTTQCCPGHLHYEAVAYVKQLFVCHCPETLPVSCGVLWRAKALLVHHTGAGAGAGAGLHADGVKGKALPAPLELETVHPYQLDCKHHKSKMSSLVWGMRLDVSAVQYCALTVHELVSAGHIDMQPYLAMKPPPY